MEYKYMQMTIILAESQHEMQAALNGLNHYCKIWKLKINVLKTEVVIFANRQPKQLPVFHKGDLIMPPGTIVPMGAYCFYCVRMYVCMYVCMSEFG